MIRILRSLATEVLYIFYKTFELIDSTVQCMCNARPLGFKPLPLDSCQVSACSCAACLATPFGFRPSPLGPRKTCLCSAEPEGATEAVRGESLSHLAGQHVAGGVSGQGFSFEMRCTEHCACCAEAESVTAVPPCPRTIAEEPDCHSLVSGFGANIICEHAFSSTLPHAAFSAGRSAPCARRARCGHEWSRDPGISHQGQDSASVAAHEPQLFAGVGVVVSGLATPEYPAETVGTIMLRCTVPLARLP